MTAPGMITCLWFHGNDMAAAVDFYVATFGDDCRIDTTQRAPSDYPGGRAGDPLTITFTLFGQPFLALGGNPNRDFTPAVSFQVHTDTQAETDRLWAALTGDGGSTMACGWCADRFGVAWQVTPRVLMAGLADPDPAAARRVFEAMMTMVKIDHAAIEAAREGG